MSAMTEIAPAPDYALIKSKQNAAWASGDYARIGTTLQIVGEDLAEAMDMRPDSTVLDVAAGNGNATLAFARRLSRVTSTDYVEKLLQRGQARAEAEGLQVEFKVADAEQLPFEDGAFDAVVSTFGVMFAPNQRKAASEMLRVCRSGGRIGMANWTPDGFIGQPVQGAGQARRAAGRRQVAGAVGKQGLDRGNIRGRGAFDRDHRARICLPLSLAGPIRRLLPHLLRSGAQGVPGARRGRPARARSRSAVDHRALRDGDRRHDAGAFGLRRDCHHQGVMAEWVAVFPQGEPPPTLTTEYCRASSTGSAATWRAACSTPGRGGGGCCAAGSPRRCSRARRRRTGWRSVTGTRRSAP